MIHYQNKNKDTKKDILKKKTHRTLLFVKMCVLKLKEGIKEWKAVQFSFSPQKKIFLVLFSEPGTAPAAATPVGAAPPVVVTPFADESAAGPVLLVGLGESLRPGGPHRRHETPPEVALPRGAWNRERGRIRFDSGFYRVG